ncbi:MAG: NAD(P)-dependent oxidoreductase [Lentisphaerae bacterium]|nr:NAD(P)-dependent oxidoreductase [Lentisphaerota bacterium]
MKVLVTGAGGLIGRVVAEALAASGHAVTATDLRHPANGRLPLHALDLLDRAAVEALMPGHEAIVHLGNHASPRSIPDGQRLYIENAAMNLNVFAAATTAGARKIVFTSSIQVLRSLFMAPMVSGQGWPPLPFDGDTPPSPNNYYGLSKLHGEDLLRLLATQHGCEATTLRLPLTHVDQEWIESYARRVSGRESDDVFAARMTAAEVGRLVDAVLRATLPGYRCYMPTLRSNMLDISDEDLRRRHFPHAPLKAPDAPLTCLTDISRITRETGWVPAC